MPGRPTARLPNPSPPLPLPMAWSGVTLATSLGALHTAVIRCKAMSVRLTSGS